MLESIIFPKKAEREPWRMFFIGIIYASLSVLLVYWFFSRDPVLYNYAGIIVVTFSVIFSLPFMFFLIRREEIEDEEATGILGVWKMHSDAVYAFMWLFFGFIVAFSFWYIVLQDSNLFNAQIQTYCNINRPGNIEDCIKQYSFESLNPTGAATQQIKFLSIISNNVYVMIFTLIFSLIFGAGAMFVLSWNASVIAAAIGVFTKYNVSEIPVGLLRYMFHGVPEIAAYFMTALAGGIFGVSFIRNGIKSKKFLRVIENSVILLFISLILLVLAALIEVYVIPFVFS